MTSPLHAAICRRGHVFTQHIVYEDRSPPKRCDTCGAEVLRQCERCNELIPGAFVGVEYEIPRFCGECASPFPWLDRKGRIWQLQNLLDDEDLDEADRLKVSEDLDALLDPGIGDDEQKRRWERVRTLAPGLMKSGSAIIETVMSAVIRAQLGV